MSNTVHTFDFEDLGDWELQVSYKELTDSVMVTAEAPNLRSTEISSYSFLKTSDGVFLNIQEG